MRWKPCKICGHKCVRDYGKIGQRLGLPAKEICVTCTEKYSQSELAKLLKRYK